MSQQRTMKQERRAAAAAAEAAAAERRRRAQAYAGAGAGLAVVVLLAVVFLVARGGDDEPAAALQSTATPAATATPSVEATPSAEASAEPQASASAAAFPPVPAGADPALGTKPVVKAGTGELTKLTVTTLIEGTGATTKSGQLVTVNYVGVSYATGEEFDSSWSRSETFAFQLGAGEVIPGWDQGLVGVKVGSRVQLDLTPDLAYGENPTGGQPAGALRFVVDVLAVR